MKKIWSGIKSLISLKPRSGSIPLISKNGTLTDPKSIAEEFNNYFASIGSTLSENIAPANIEPESFLGPQLVNSFSLFPVTSIQIEDEIQNLNSSKATGPSSIPVCLLKILKTCLSKPLEILSNHSFVNGCVPDQLKLAVIPVHKKGSVTCLTNYRPISLLSV